MEVMVARLDSVCKYICEKGGWKVSNLQLQKVLYLAQMIYMGRNDGEPLTQAKFEAWDYGPVEPTVYRKVRMFGSAPIQDVFFEALNFKNESPRKRFLDEACEYLLPLRAGQLVEIIHWNGGAWAKYYEPGIRGINIPNADILREYSDRIRDGNLEDKPH